MIWIAPSEKDTATETLEERLWDAADQFRANSGLKAQEYSGPILGLIFLRFAEVRFTAQRAKLEKAGASPRRASRIDDPATYHAEGILHVGVAAGEAVSDEDFKEQLETLNEELETLNAQARELEDTIAKNVTGILEA
jgi:type I restriction-modification system DNA methylase subunit